MSIEEKLKTQGWGENREIRFPTDGVDEHGIVEDCIVETYIIPIDYFDAVPGPEGYLRVILDGPGHNYECRIPVEILDHLVRAVLADPEATP